MLSTNYSAHLGCALQERLQRLQGLLVQHCALYEVSLQAFVFYRIWKHRETLWHLKVFGAMLLVIRVAPYAFHYCQKLGRL